MPSGAGGAGRRGGGTGGGDVNRFTHILWYEATLSPTRVVTLREGEKEGPPPVEPLDDPLRKTLHLSGWDPRPALLYFHYPHEDGEETAEARVSAKQCKAFDDEMVARWCGLFTCIEIDMGASDKKVAERLGWAEGVTFSIVNGDLEVMTTSPSVTSSKAITGFLRSAVTSKRFEAYWADVQKRLAEQESLLKEARALAAKKKLREALETYRQLYLSDLRIADWWESVAKEVVDLEKKVDEERGR